MFSKILRSSLTAIELQQRIQSGKVFYYYRNHNYLERRIISQTRQQYRLHSTKKNDGNIEVKYVTKDGETLTIFGNEGDNLMHLAQRNDIEIEGACEASLACCTCHVYVEQQFFDKLEPPCEEEEDLLDMAPFLKPNSRLGCQVILTKELSGIEVKLPPATRNFYVDGAKPSHH